MPAVTVIPRRRLLTLGMGAALSVAAGCRLRDSDGKTTLRYMAWGNPEQLAVEKQIAGEFEKLRPDVRVHLFMVPGAAYGDKLQLMLASRTAPDVMRVDHYIFPSLVRKEYFLPLDSFIAREQPGFLDDFTPVALEECRYQNKLMAMNVLFGPYIIYYNKTLFAQAGLPDPYALSKKDEWTWDTFVRAAEALTTRTKDGRPEQFGTNMVTYPQYSPVLWNHGGDFMNPDMTRMTLAEEPGGIAGMKAYADLRWKQQVAPTPADNALSPFTFESGKVAMQWGWSGETPRYRKNIKDFEWDITPTPSGPVRNQAMVKGNQLVVSKGSRHPELAWEFVKFMTSPETELLICGKLRRSVPTRFSVQKDPRYLHAELPPYQTDVFLESVQRGRTLPINARYQEWLQEYNTATEPLFNTNSITPEEAARNATARVNSLLAGEEGF